MVQLVHVEEHYFLNSTFRLPINNSKSTNLDSATEYEENNGTEASVKLSSLNGIEMLVASINIFHLAGASSREEEGHTSMLHPFSLSLILSFCICRAIQTENEIRYFTKRRISLQIIHHTQETKKNMSISLASSFYFYLICSSIESMNFATKFPFHFFCLMNDGAKKRVSSLSFSICRNSCREIRSSLFKSKLAMIS